MKEKYGISEFEIEIIKLERIFIDKIFAAEFYYERKMYEDVSKHLYDITIMMDNEGIKKLLNDKLELNKLIGYKRKEEEMRIGGISGDKKIINFNYMKLDFDDDLVKAFNKMQSIYVLDDASKITIEDVKESLKYLMNIFKILQV